MIPSGNKLLTTELKVVTQPSKQHQMLFDGHRIVNTCDNLEAVKQAVFKILNTERYDYIIYSWNYGVELMDLYGKPFVFACPEIERRVKEALLQDDRIKGVDEFEFKNNGHGVVHVTFTVHTIFGDMVEEMVVNI